jgi:hypothetical protein
MGISGAIFSYNERVAKASVERLLRYCVHEQAWEQFMRNRLLTPAVQDSVTVRGINFADNEYENAPRRI